MQGLTPCFRPCLLQVLALLDPANAHTTLGVDEASASYGDLGEMDGALLQLLSDPRLARANHTSFDKLDHFESAELPIARAMAKLASSVRVLSLYGVDGETVQDSAANVGGLFALSHECGASEMYIQRQKVAMPRLVESLLEDAHRISTGGSEVDDGGFMPRLTVIRIDLCPQLVTSEALALFGDCLARLGPRQQPLEVAVWGEMSSDALDAILREAQDALHAHGDAVRFSRGLHPRPWDL